MRERLPDFTRLPDDDVHRLQRLAFAVFSLLLLLLLLIVVYAIGEKLEEFSWQTLLNGFVAFGTIVLSVGLAVMVMIGLIHGTRILLPERVLQLAERRQLRRSQRKVRMAIEDKQKLSEERARITSRLQATYLFEKETTHAANAQASREFREALQASVMRSCEIAFDHIAEVVSQHEKVVQEITTSELPDTEKAQLLDSLATHLSVAATRGRNKDARKMMETEIWKVRFRKARAMAKDQPAAAIAYLKQVEREARGSRLKTEIGDLIESLSAVG